MSYTPQITSFKIHSGSHVDSFTTELLTGLNHTWDLQQEAKRNCIQTSNSGIFSYCNATKMPLTCCTPIRKLKLLVHLPWAEADCKLLTVHHVHVPTQKEVTTTSQISTVLRITILNILPFSLSPLHLLSTTLAVSYHIWLKCGYEKERVEYLLTETVTISTWTTFTYPQHSSETQKCGCISHLQFK